MAKYGTGARYGTGHRYGETTPPVPVEAISWTPTGGGNHGGADWIIAEDLIVAGVHLNVGRFEIVADVTVTVLDYDGSTFGALELHAQDVEIGGALLSSGVGYRGGVAQVAGEGPFGGAAGQDGGYLATAGQGDATTDDSGVKGSGGGGSTVADGASGGDGGGLIRLFSAARIFVPSSGIILAHGAPEGDVNAGHGAGGGIVLKCDGPYGVDVDGVVATLGAGQFTVNGGTLKRIALPAGVLAGGTVNAGRLFTDQTLRRARVVT